MNRDELLAHVWRIPPCPLDTDSHVHVADHLLPLIEQERRAAQVEVLRRMAERSMGQLDRAKADNAVFAVELAYGWAATTATTWADEIEREGAPTYKVSYTNDLTGETISGVVDADLMPVDKIEREGDVLRGRKSGPRFDSGLPLPLLTEEEVGECWDEQAGGVASLGDWQCQGVDGDDHAFLVFANACIAKANDKAGHSATEPSAEPDFTDGTWHFQSEFGNDPFPHWTTDIHSLKARRWDGEREPYPIVAVKVSGSPIRVKVTTETKIEKVEP